jgi:tetratricopeptide (TPR) repeat protein
MKHLISRALCISTLLFGLFGVVLPTYAATTEIAAGKRAFVSYQVANPLPLFASAIDDPANATPDQALTLLQLGMPIRITKGPIQAGGNTWWRVHTIQGDGWIMDAVSVNGKTISTLVPSTPDRFNSVIKALTGLLKTKPTAEAYDSRGLAYLGLSFIGQINYKAAAVDFANAVKLDPKFAWAYAHQAEALLEMNHYKDALASIDQALAISPEEVAFFHTRSEINFAFQQYPSSLGDALKARALKPDNATSLFDQAIATEKMYNGAGVPPDSLAKQIVASDPDYADAWRVLARFASRNGDNARAKDFYSKAIDAEPTGPQAYISRAYFEIDYTQEFDAAESDLNQASKLDPQNARVYAAFGYFYGAARGDDKTALASYNKAVKLDPYDTDNYLDLSFGYLRVNQYDNAISAAKQAIATSPDLPCACGYFRLGNAYYAKGDFKNALDAYKQFLTLASAIDSETSAMVQSRIQEIESKKQ